jgi:hypothetical protein
MSGIIKAMSISSQRDMLRLSSVRGTAEKQPNSNDCLLKTDDSKWIA